MIFCTRCRRLVPEGDYCPWCRGSWGASICQDCEHRNAGGVPSCVKCPGVNLSDAVLGIPLGWTATLLSGLLLFGLIRFIALHASTIFPSMGNGSVWLLCTVTGATRPQLQQLAWWVVALVFFLAPLAGELLRRVPGQGGMLGYRLRALPMTALDYLWHLSLRTLLGGGRLIIQLFFGKKLIKGGP